MKSQLEIPLLSSTHDLIKGKDGPVDIDGFTSAMLPTGVGGTDTSVGVLITSSTVPSTSSTALNTSMGLPSTSAAAVFQTSATKPGMQHTSTFANTSADGHGSSAPPPAAAPLAALAPAARAEFGSVGGTGFPMNAAAKQQVRGEWAGTAASGDPIKVRRLEYASLTKATDGFSELCRIGGGGSCEVFRAQVRHAQGSTLPAASCAHHIHPAAFTKVCWAQVFGFLVAIKRLTEGASDWDTRQFEAEYEVLVRACMYVRVWVSSGWQVNVQ